MKSKKSRFGNWLFFIFGLVFFLSGLGASYGTFGKMTVQYFASTNWEQVPATITHLTLQKHYGDSTTYQVEAQYQYFYNGERESDSVTFNDSSDNVGSYWQDLHKKLKRERANDQVVAWVNPNDPDQALLDRTFRWAQVAFGGIFLLMFCGFGGVAMWASLKASKPVDEIRKEATLNGISSKEKNGFWFVFLFGSVFFIIGFFTFILALPEIIDKGNYAALLTLLFVVVGGGIMSYALINQRRYKLIGPTPLFLDPLPGALGGQIGGQFTIQSRSQDTPIKIVLSCKRQVKSGKNTNTKLIWQESMQGYIKSTARGMNVQFLFDCPDNLPDSNSSSVFWEVRAESELNLGAKSIKFQRNWDIPVESSKLARSSIRIPEHFLQQQNELKAEMVQADAAGLIQFHQQGNFLEVDNISRKSIGGFVGGLVSGLVFSGTGIFTLQQNWWPGYIFIFVGAIIIYVSFFVFGRGIEVKVDTSARVLYTRRKWFGFVLYKRKVMLFNPEQFSIKKTSSSSTNTQLTEWYKVEVKNKDKQVLIAEGVKGKDVAQALMNNIIEKAFPRRY